ncbi:hypothetical protein [Rhodococcus sp. IEGM 1379]|uniref:hypothetical protein n=1 Tax=Rhodococcus sp. IEGM 1379 TaxID=3047086 RepID=UPI0024B79C04|nr:hypothetical protein [Rhodococcus sp. IEGM 1379]MDI9914372.1 hypothetical protein [Rhodococcus sp. IEGM 1379]
MTAPLYRAETLACEIAVLRALELAAKRSLGRRTRGTAPEVPAHLLHTHLRIAGTHEDCDKLLVGAWEHMTIVIPEATKLRELCDWYVRELIVTRRPHTRADLERVLAVAHE